VFYR